jgi:hypothetical protein
MECFLKTHLDTIIYAGVALIAFISWLAKSLVEKPIKDSRITFDKLVQDRVVLLSKVKLRLKFIEQLPQEDNGREYKDEIRDILKKEDKDIYLLKEECFEDILKISMTQETDKNLLLETIKNIDEELKKQISMLNEKTSFFRQFSGYGLIGLLTGNILLVIIYLIVTIFLVFLFISAFFEMWCAFAIVLLLMASGVIMLIALNKYANDKSLEELQ